MFGKLISQWVYRDTGRLLKRIALNDLVPSQDRVSSTAGFETLSSYSWSTSNQSLFYIPGAAAEIKLPSVPVSVAPDGRTLNHGQETKKVERLGLLPLLASLERLNPRARLLGVDLLAKRNSLLELFGFVSNVVNEDFRIDAYLVHGTLVLQYREKSTHLIVHGSQNSGYGRNFKKALTVPFPGLEDTQGHHRVIRYSLGGLSCVIEVEIDACMPNDEIGEVKELKKGPDPPTRFENSLLRSEDSLVTSPLMLREHGLDIEQGGKFLDGRKLAEIRTCTKSLDSQKSFKFPQLWFGRTSHLVVGKHRVGDNVFSSIKVCDMEAEFADHESNMQTEFKRLVTLIRDLRFLVAVTENQRCIITCDHSTQPLELKVFENMTPPERLPDKVIEHFWGNRDDGAGQN